MTDATTERTSALRHERLRHAVLDAIAYIPSNERSGPYALRAKRMLADILIDDARETSEDSCHTNPR